MTTAGSDQARRACELSAAGWPWPAAVKLSRLGPLDSGPIEAHLSPEPLLGRCIRSLPEIRWWGIKVVRGGRTRTPVKVARPATAFERLVVLVVLAGVLAGLAVVMLGVGGLVLRLVGG